MRPTDRLRPTLPRICEESDGGAGRGQGGALSRLRSASECSLESDMSDTDQYGGKNSGHSASDTESDIEMEVGPLTLTQSWLLEVS